MVNARVQDCVSFLKTQKEKNFCNLKDILQLQYEHSELDKEDFTGSSLTRLSYGARAADILRLKSFEQIRRTSFRDFILRPASDAVEAMDREVTDEEYEHEAKLKITASQRWDCVS